MACELVISEMSVRCKKCMNFRGCLRVQSRRLQSRGSLTERTNASSSTPYSILTSEEMQIRMRNLHDKLRKVQKQRDRLKDKVSRLVEKQGITVDEKLHGDLKNIIQSEGSKRMKGGESNTFQHIFWQQQVHAASKKDARGMRWHPLMIKWCIYLRYLSQGAYETLRKSNCITLPSQRTLRDYTHHYKPGTGFSAAVDTQLYNAARLDVCEERDKCIILLLDEMYVKQELVFDKNTGELIGFTDLGDINSHLMDFERSVASSESTDDEPLLAKTMMTYMVRGLFTRLEYPYAHFPSLNLTGELMFHPLWESVYRLERLGFKVPIII